MEVAEDKIILLDVLTELETTKYTHRFDTEDIIVMCNKVENELYRIKAKEEKKQLMG